MPSSVRSGPIAQAFDPMVSASGTSIVERGLGAGARVERDVGRRAPPSWWSVRPWCWGRSGRGGRGDVGRDGSGRRRRGDVAEQRVDARPPRQRLEVGREVVLVDRAHPRFAGAVARHVRRAGVGEVAVVARLRSRARWPAGRRRPGRTPSWRGRTGPSRGTPRPAAPSARRRRLRRSSLPRRAPARRRRRASRGGPRRTRTRTRSPGCRRRRRGCAARCARCAGSSPRT